jgi:hypothetical protein
MSSNRSRCTAAGGVLAVGLGVGAALVATSGVASADPSTDPFSWIGGLDLGALSAAAPSDMQISIDGMDLFPTLGNTATATSGMGDIAIAIGGGSDAFASDGIGDFAFADGPLTDAEAAFGNFDSATAVGNDSNAIAAIGNLDTASIFGNDSEAFARLGNGDLASVVDTGSTADNAFAGGVGAVNGSNDIATIFGTASTAEAGSNATTAGDFDLAAVFGDTLNASVTGVSNMVDILPSL